jgi:hypothetical protein
MSPSEVFTLCPCLSGGCLDWRADRVRAAVGAAYIATLRGEKPRLLPLDELMSGCCKRGIENGMTFVTSEPVERLPRNR